MLDWVGADFNPALRNNLGAKRPRMPHPYETRESIYNPSAARVWQGISDDAWTAVAEGNRARFLALLPARLLSTILVAEALRLWLA